MIDLYLNSKYDGETQLRKTLQDSLPGLKVYGPVLEGKQSTELARYLADREAHHRQHPRSTEPPCVSMRTLT